MVFRSLYHKGEGREDSQIITRIAWHGCACRRALCLIRQVLAIVTSGTQRFLSEWPDLHWRRIIRLGRAWAKKCSSSDNTSVYKYVQADGSSDLTSYSRWFVSRTIAIASVDGWSVCLPVFIHRRIIRRANRSLPKSVLNGLSVSSIKSGQ